MGTENPMRAVVTMGRARSDWSNRNSGATGPRVVLADRGVLGVLSDASQPNQPQPRTPGRPHFRRTAPLSHDP